MFCSNCGNQLPDGSQFCDKCGARLGSGQSSPQGMGNPGNYQQPQGGYQQPQGNYQQPQGGYQQPQGSQQYRPEGFRHDQPQGGGGFVKFIVGVVIVGALLIGGKYYLDNRDKADKEESVSEERDSSAGKSSSGDKKTEDDKKNSGKETAEKGEESSKEGTAVDTTVDPDAAGYENMLKGGLGIPAGGTSEEAEGSSTGQTGSSTESAIPTGELTKVEDFTWFYNEKTGKVDVNIPEGAEKIDDPSEVAGGWKCLVVRHPNTETRREYWNLDLTPAGKEVYATVYWSGFLDGDGEFEDSSAANPFPMHGVITDSNLLSLQDDYGSTFEINEWYSYKGKQYGVGTYECGWDQEDASGYAALYR